MKNKLTVDRKKKTHLKEKFPIKINVTSINFYLMNKPVF